MPHLATWKKSQAAFRNSSEARPISGILPALIADSIPPAILGNRSSGGSGSVISRSLSTKDFRFRLRGGESVNIPISFCMRREIPAKSLEASIEKNSPMERETCCSRRWSRPSGSDPRQTGRSRAFVPGIFACTRRSRSACAVLNVVCHAARRVHIVAAKLLFCYARYTSTSSTSATTSSTNWLACW